MIWQIFGLISFLILSLFCFTIPGLFLVVKSKIEVNDWEKIVLATGLGLVIFTLTSYIFFVLNLIILILPAILIIDFFSFKEIKKHKIALKFFSRNYQTIFLTVFILGIIFQLLIIAPSGRLVNGDLVFWSSHAHDASWHIGLMNQLVHGWPLENPIYANERVVNYHFFSDIAPSFFSYFFKFSALDLYFRFFPLLFSLLYTSAAFIIGKKLTKSFWGGFWSLIFANFAGSFGFIVTYFRNGTIGGESLFWSSQAQSAIGNPPQISAMLLMLIFFILFINYFEKKNKYILFSLFLIGGSMIVFKVYAGIALLGGLSVCSFWQLIKDRDPRMFITFLGSGLLSSLLFFPNASGSVSFLIFEPWWYIRTLVVAPDRLNELDWELKRQTYISDGNWKRVVQLETQAFLIFFFGNLGMRSLALLSLPKFVKSFFSNYFNQLILTIGLISLVFPMLFIQKGDTAGTSQFFQYLLLVTGILSAVSVVSLGQKIKLLWLKIILGFLIILIAVPTQIGLLFNFYSRTAFAKIDSEELNALAFLRNSTPQSSVILNPLFNKFLVIKDPIPQIWGWSDTGYIGAFGNRVTYLSDQEQVANTGYDYLGRKDLEEQLFIQKDPLKFNQLINQSSANYLYFPKLQRPVVDLNKTGLKRVFENSEIEIWQIR